MAQWDGIRKNLGDWQGSFTQLTPDGIERSDTPSRLILEDVQEAQRIRLVLQRWPEDGPPSTVEQSFLYPGPGPMVPFFDTGAFSQGSSQWAPYSQCGAEMAFVWGDRRLRLVQLFNGTLTQPSHLTGVTLIRETRSGTTAMASPRLQVEQLVGRWQGTSVTILANGHQQPAAQTTLELMQEDATTLHQTLTLRSAAEPLQIQSHGTINHHHIHFGRKERAVTVLLLPGGASVTVPAVIQGDRDFFIEAGWLIEPGHRQRLIRRYDASGAWHSLTLVQEHKQE